MCWIHCTSYCSQQYQDKWTKLNWLEIYSWPCTRGFFICVFDSGRKRITIGKIFSVNNDLKMIELCLLFCTVVFCQLVLYTPFNYYLCSKPNIQTYLTNAYRKRRNCKKVTSCKWLHSQNICTTYFLVIS